MPIYERLGDLRSKAVTQRRIADILQARGQVAEALQILKEETLPAYEHLGDVRSKAGAQGNAEMMQELGQVDEALRILKEEVLPVYEDAGSAAKAVAQITVRHSAGLRSLDEALHILEETLAVYERMGDVRSKALTQGRIAVIWQVRGQFDEA